MKCYENKTLMLQNLRFSKSIIVCQINFWYRNKQDFEGILLLPDFNKGGVSQLDCIFLYVCYLGPCN